MSKLNLRNKGWTPLTVSRFINGGVVIPASDHFPTREIMYRFLYGPNGDGSIEHVDTLPVTIHQFIITQVY